MSLPKSSGPGPRVAPVPAGDTEHLCRLLESHTAAAFAVPVSELRAPSRRTRLVAFARQSAMYLAHVMLGRSHSATAGRSTATGPLPRTLAGWLRIARRIRPSTAYCSR